MNLTKLFLENRLYIYPLIALFISFLTYFKGYEKPNAPFWDENYHIASAQKYIEGVMFMEPHPPLGKMFIALGEVLLNPNKGLDLSAFTKTDYIKGHQFPEGYSFAGVRFFPTLFATLCVVPLFFILYLISKNSEISLLLSSLYLFENAFIVHSRAAMLEPVVSFFILLSLLYFVYLIEKKRVRIIDYAILGVLIGLAAASKVTAFILLLLFVFLYFADIGIDSFFNRFNNNLKRLFLGAIASIIGIGSVFLVVFYLHAALGKKIETNSYKASKEYLEIIKNQKVASITSLPTILKDNYKYMSEYQKGVPRLDLCKPGENGSMVVGWPFMIKSINYRWDKNTENGITYTRYIQLIGNPIIWYSAVFAIFLGVVLIAGHYIFKTPIKDKRLFFYIGVFVTLYLSYMIAVSQIERVMYLYHYFIPLIFAIVVIFLMIVYIFKEELEQKNLFTYINITLFCLLIFFVYLHFMPLSYHLPLTADEFKLRNWFSFWQMKVVEWKI